MKLTESQLKQIVKEEISKTLNEVNSASWFVKVGHDKMSVPKKQAENAVQALELAILNRLNHPEISDKMKKTIVDYYMERSYTVVDLSTGDKHKNIQVSDSFLKTNKDLLDKYSPILEGRNNMKLTESQLRKIIREELEAVREVKIADFVDRYKEIAKEAGFYYPPGGVVNNLARIAAEKQRLEIPTEDQMAAFRNQAAKELGIPDGPMDEEKLEPGLDVIANLFKDYRAKYGVNFDRFLFYVRQMLKKEGIDAKQLANKEDMKATIKSIAQDAGAMLKMAKKKDRLPLRR